MRVVVLGGSGFLGSHVVRRLREDGHAVVSVARRVRDGDVGDAGRRVVDLFAEDAPLTSLLDGADACIHLAGDLVPASAEAEGWQGYQRNLELANRVAEACIASGVRRLVFASSGGTVYGADVLGAKESMACRPIGMYGAQKLAIESLLFAKLMRTGCELTVLRISNPFGMGQESQRAHGVIGRIFNCMRDGGEFTVWGDGTQVRDYVHVSDVADAFVRALDYRQQGGALFNIGSGEGVDTDTLVSLCTEVSGVRLQYSCRPKSAFEVDRISLDIEAAGQYLRWRPSMTLKQGLDAYFKQLVEITS